MAGSIMACSRDDTRASHRFGPGARGACASCLLTESSGPAGLSRRPLFRLLGFGLADALDGDDFLVFGRLEDPHALRRAFSEADAFDRYANQLSTIGDEHQLIGFLHRERGDERPDFVELVEVGGLDALTAAIGGAEVVGG